MLGEDVLFEDLRGVHVEVEHGRVQRKDVLGGDLGRARCLGADNLLEIVRHVPGASGCFGRQKNRKRHERAHAADHDPDGAHDCLQFETYSLGQAAPVSTHAATSAPASFCVPGAGFRPGPGAHAHPTR